MDERPVTPAVTPPINLTATFNLPARSVILPAWLLICCLACFVMAAVGLILVWHSNTDLRREIRILQLHAQGIEAVMQSKNIAKPADFAPWEEDPVRPDRQKGGDPNVMRRYMQGNH